MGILCQGEKKLPNGHTLSWEPSNLGGRRYFSDESGQKVEIWNTSGIQNMTLLAAIAQEIRLIAIADYERNRADRIYENED